MPVIETKNLVKSYRAIQALKGVSLQVEKGEVYGLLGQNGAGKTTLIKILLGITRGWGGQAELLGRPPTASTRRRIGYLPEDHRFPDYHTGASLLHFYGGLYGMPRRDRVRKIPEVLETVGIKDRMHYKIRTYSKGMKQRLGVAQAMFHDPDIIFLDEPTDGVDPVGRREIRTLIQTLKARGTTIFLNSHLLGEVEIICDRVAILRKGDLVQEGTVASLTQQKGVVMIGLAPGQVLPVEEVDRVLRQQLDAMSEAILDPVPDDAVAARPMAARAVVKSDIPASFVRPAGEFWEIALIEGLTIDPVVDLVRARGLSVRHLVEKRQSLEDLFVKTVKDT